MTNPSWGTKRNCPSCSAHFYDLNKLPASCPKCNHTFDPNAVARVKRKPTRREAPESDKELPSSVLASKKAAVRKKEPKELDDAGREGGIGDIAEMDDDDIDNLQDLSELEEREEPTVSGDDADDEAIIEELDAGDKTIIGNVEEEEANALEDELDDESGETSSSKKAKARKKSK